MNDLNSRIRQLTKLILTHPYGLMHGGLLNSDEWEERYHATSKELEALKAQEVDGQTVEDDEEEDDEDDEEGEDGETRLVRSLSLPSMRRHTDEKLTWRTPLGITIVMRKTLLGAPGRTRTCVGGSSTTDTFGAMRRRNVTTWSN